MPFPFMTQRLLKRLVTTALLLLPSLLAAQQVAASEEERLAAIMADPSRWYVPKNTVTIGFRMLSSGARVNFGNLGSVDFSTTAAPLADGAVRREYDNGFVGTDALSDRPEETAAPKTVTTDTSRVVTTTTQLPGGRYEVNILATAAGEDGVLDTTDDVSTSTTRNFLSYVAGLTRTWAYLTPEQAALRPGYIAMSSYSAVSDGASLSNEQGPTGGIELQFTRSIGKTTGRLQWGIATGISLNGINSKTAGDVLSTLRTNTDFYSLNGLTAPETSVAVPYSAPSLDDQTDADGNIVLTDAIETTVPLSDVPAEHSETAVKGAATVHGVWQVKGAYFMVKLGPAVRARLTDRIGLSASIGLAGAYSGTNYSVTESFEAPIIGDAITTPNPTQSTASKFLSGYYADLNLEWAATERTGLFGGVTAQKMGDYEQLVGSRTALIDLGNSVGIRGGVSIRF